MKKKLTKLILAVAITVVAIVMVSVFLSRKPSDKGVSTSSELEFSEIMLSNKGSVADANGDYPDWVELHNTSANELDIGGMGLSDDVTKGVKYVFPAGTRVAGNGYVIVWLSGEATDVFYAPFRISAGESLILFNSSGNTVETVLLNAVESGKSLAKNASGMWEPMLPSPGFPNDDAGIAEYESNMMSAENTGIVINEFMASNATTVIDCYGNYSDWMELYNSNPEDVDISGWGISDTIVQPKKYILPEGTVVPAGGTLLIFLSGNEGFSESGELHAPFSLKAFGEDVVLSDRSGAIVDSFGYSNQESDVSMARVIDGTGDFAAAPHPTPGYLNSDEGYNAFMAANPFPRGNVMISEVSGANATLVSAKDGNHYDFIELHNTGAEPVSLFNYALSDNPKNPAKWVFPDVSIPADGYLLVFASGIGGETDGELHASFGLDEGESVYLFSPEHELLDRLQPGVFMTDTSFGRSGSGLVYFRTPTPGSVNGDGMEGITAVPVFSEMPGIFDAPVTLSLSAGAGEKIYYTLDCTTPTETSTLYGGEPIEISKNTVVRAVAIKEGYITNQTVSGTFLFRSDGVDHAIPVATLVTDPDNLWSNEKGIYAYGELYDPDLPYDQAIATAQFYKSKQDPDAWERPAAFSIFDDNGKEAFSQNIGIRIAGSFGRGRAQKGFNIIARDGYGANRMEYAFFDNREFTEYKSLVLRAGGQDQSYGKFRDELSLGLLEDSDVNILYQAYKPYVLYLNGEYWGVYFLKEKRNRFFVAQHEGVEDNDNIDIVRSTSYAYNGTTDGWKEVMNYLAAHDLNDQEAYRWMDEHVDLGSFMDYMICEIYSANSDVWNIQMCKTADGKWKWIYYDFCWSFGSSENKWDHKTVSIRRLNTKPCSDLFNALLKVPSWKDAFCRRFSELLRTVYSPENVLKKIDELYAVTEPEMAREREKFNSPEWMGIKQHDVNISSYDKYIKQVDIMREFAQKRPDSLKKQLKESLGLSDAYMEEVFG